MPRKTSDRNILLVWPWSIFNTWHDKMNWFKIRREFLLVLWAVPVLQCGPLKCFAQKLISANRFFIMWRKRKRLCKSYFSFIPGRQFELNFQEATWKCYSILHLCARVYRGEIARQQPLTFGSAEYYSKCFIELACLVRLGEYYFCSLLSKFEVRSINLQKKNDNYVLLPIQIVTCVWILFR